MKKVLAGLLVISMIFLLIACDGTSKVVTLPDTDTVARALVGQLEFDDDLEETRIKETILLKYGIDDEDVTDVTRFVGSGATADEVAVFKCANADARNRIELAVRDRIQYLHDGYSDYGPEEVPKIDDAFLETYGDYIVFCICRDSSSVTAVIESISSGNTAQD